MRLRITYSKIGSLRYTGHLDLHQVWERTVRRAGFPLAYTQGFHPTPRLQIAAALPLGFIGRQEVLDLWLNAPPPPGDLRQLLQSAAPPGLGILSIVQVDDKSPALQTQVEAAEYQLAFLEPVDPLTLAAGVAQVLAAESLPRQRRGKPYDLRPLLLSLALLPAAESPAADQSAPSLTMLLAAREGATGRPEEVLAVLGLPPENARIERTRLIFKNAIE
jgi:radical SAM-linked protein